MSLISHGYATEEAYSLYVNYLAMKKHFTTDNYDYNKYNGKIRTSFDKFQTRSDVYFFHKLSKMDDPQKVMLSNMIVKPDIWIRDIVEESGEQRYLEWRKRMESLTYLFKTDLNKLDDNYQANYAVHNGQHPHLISLYLQRQISLESLSILSAAANIFPYWEKEIVDKFVARDIIRLSKKYRPFLDIQEKKFKDLIRERFF